MPEAGMEQVSTRIAAPSVVDSWFIKGDGVVRMFGRRPLAAHDQAPGMIRLVVQPVVCGVVIAWRPYWEQWVEPQVADLMASRFREAGWKECPRPKVSFKDAGRASTVALEEGIMPLPESLLLAHQGEGLCLAAS
jgi:hypothetical protein